MISLLAVIAAGGLVWVGFRTAAHLSRRTLMAALNRESVVTFVRATIELQSFFLECVLENAKRLFPHRQHPPGGTFAQCTMTAYALWGCGVYLQMHRVFLIPLRVEFLSRIWDDAYRRFDAVELNEAFQAITMNERDKSHQAGTVIARIVVDQQGVAMAFEIDSMEEMRVVLAPLAELFLGYLGLLLEQHFRPRNARRARLALKESVVQAATSLTIDTERLDVIMGTRTV